MRTTLASFALLAALAPQALAQSAPTISNPSRVIQADVEFVDAVFFDTVGDFMSFQSIVAGPIDEAVDAGAGSFGSSVYASSEQFGDIDVQSASFDAYGAAAAGLYVQGSGLSLATSLFELKVDLTYDGRLFLSGDLSTSDAFGGFFPQDRPGVATVDLQVVDAATDVVLFGRSTAFGGVDQLLDGTVVHLPAGTYRLSIAAVAADATNGIEQINGSNVAGVFDVQGRFEQDAPTTAHVAAIEVDAILAGGKLVAFVRVQIVDAAGLPVAGSRVAGHFFGDVGGSLRATTDARGIATFVRTAPATVGTPRFAFGVDGLAHPTLVYDPGANIETVEAF
ncbi:hypothetical protein Pla163_33170 [Planctomycetes bacterium Pla163]|uniref:Bacterial Ig-like domain (Group 1) n=1 Tax=Rohdeia mirabilis TaxID=2528008 RepID=A0A518D3Y1_9BACT|nr:hypothetical protein Pla163_33170 [Planctomycetes bacterium Pla163]